LTQTSQLTQKLTAEHSQQQKIEREDKKLKKEREAKHQEQKCNEKMVKIL